MHAFDDNIAAIGTAAGEGGIAIVRLCGPDCLNIADKVFKGRTLPSSQKGRTLPSSQKGGRFFHGWICEEDGRHIDEVLVLIMRNPHSYTGEDMVEIQGHGGSVVARRVLHRVLEFNCRLAEPGEFTRRAFLNGRIDLLQAEGVLDLIKAQSDQAAQIAVEQLDGALTEKFNTIFDLLLSSASDLEVSLDFPEEDGIPEVIHGQLTKKLETAQQAIDALLATWNEGRLYREGLLVVISGSPNVGKSTLLNALLGSDRAIVSDIPGTTRDVIEEGIVLDGVPLRLVDTAGLRETDCIIEQEGIRRSRQVMGSAAVHIPVLQADRTLSEDEKEHLKNMDPEHSIVVMNKIDLVTTPLPRVPDNMVCIKTSLQDGKGLEDVKNQLSNMLHTTGVMPHASISERHREQLLLVKSQLTDAQKMLSNNDEEEFFLVGSLLRDALDHLGEVTGRVSGEELLDHVFSNFCIGK